MGWDDINYQVLVSLGMKRNTQARDTYLDATASTPDYISSLASVASPMRERHQDSLH